MKAINTAFYGDETRWFIGVVRALQPETGRVRVRIHGVHNSNHEMVHDEHLPWAQVVMPNTTTGIAGLIPATGLRIGAKVFGIFADGKGSQLPLVLGVLTAIAIPPIVSMADREVSQYVPVSESATVNPVNAAQYNNIPMTQGSNAEVVYDYIHAYMSQNGAANPVAVASGFIGNFINEAGPALSPNAQERSPIAGRGGYGLAQWTGPRRRAIEAYATSVGVQLPNSDAVLTEAENTRLLQMQLQFWAREMETTHRHVFTKVKRATTVTEVNKIVFDKYETPATVVDYYRVIEGRPPKFHNAGTDIAAAYQSELNQRLSASIAIEDNFGQ